MVDIQEPQYFCPHCSNELSHIRTYRTRDRTMLQHRCEAEECCMKHPDLFFDPSNGDRYIFDYYGAGEYVKDD